MNSDQGRDKEINYVCNDCGTVNDDSHRCTECRLYINYNQCFISGGRCYGCDKE